AWARCASLGVEPPAKGLYIRIDAKPQAATAQFGSSPAISWKVASACGHQNECSMATPRVTFCCTFGLHELGKLTLPSFPLPASSSCAKAKADATIPIITDVVRNS